MRVSNAVYHKGTNKAKEKQKKYLYNVLNMKEFKRENNRERERKRESGNKDIDMMVYFRCKSSVYVYIRDKKTTYIS